MKHTVLAIPMGDPAGIGPEIVIKALSTPVLDNDIAVIVIGDRFVFEKLMGDCSLNDPFERVVSSDEECRSALADSCKTVFYNMDLVDRERFAYGVIDGMYGRAAYAALAKAVHCIQRGMAHALVTPPLHKESLKAAGIPCIGHTEILGDLTKSDNPVTMFETLHMKIFFLTRHLSLKNACDAVTFERVLSSIRTCDHITRAHGFTLSLPLAVAALNPHGGEHGMFGTEEETAIIPAIEQAKKEGCNVIGPVSADAVFHLAKNGNYRAVLSLYHDQGHIAAKTLDFDRTVSVTWQLPFLRTSVDHGTAFDIAGKGVASPLSMIEAIKVALHYLGKGAKDA